MLAVFLKFLKAYDTPWKYRFQNISLLWGGKENYPISISSISTRNVNVKINSTFLNLFEQEVDFPKTKIRKAKTQYNMCWTLLYSSKT
jgi:hypothetical protein